jgi:2-oxoglutarate dehydrogenase complex dehydrogenase (E1) component-like enzyme
MFINEIIFVFSYAGRDTAAATATGSKVMHYKELKSLLNEAMSF